MHERGSTMAEFAIVLAASLTIIFGIIDFGRAMYTYHSVANAARLATRYAIVRGSSCTVSGCPATTTSVQNYVRSFTSDLDVNLLTVNTSWQNSAGCSGAPFQGPGCLVTVQVAYDFKLLVVPLLPAFKMPMKSTSQMVISQ